MSPIVTASLTGVVLFCTMVAILQMLGKRHAQAAQPKPEPVPLNRRKTTRIPVNSEIDIYWQDIDASHKAARVLALDVSERGACIRSAKPIICSSVVYVRARHVNFEGQAVVRRCVRKGLRYIIGLELQGPLTREAGLGA